MSSDAAAADRPAPLVPGGCDLRNFRRMPLDVRRLLTSDTWIEAAGVPFLSHALLSLWSESWHQLPAGSLPDVDATLLRLSGCTSADQWQAVRAQALRGWVRCSDGRLYHPVVCAMALEAYLEKLDARLRGAKGLASRWGTDADAERADLEAELHRTRDMLARLDPTSPGLAKRRSVPARKPAADKPATAPPPANPAPPAPADAAAGPAGDGKPMALPLQGHGSAMAGPWLCHGNRTEQNGIPPYPPPTGPVDNSAGPLAAGRAPPGPVRLPRGTWWDTRQGVEQAGMALGIGRWDERAFEVARGPAWPAYKARVLEAAGDGPWLPRAPVAAAVQVMGAIRRGVRH